MSLKTHTRQTECGPPDIGTALRKIRQKHFYSQLCVAYAVGISRNTYQLWEANKVNLGILQIFKICKFYDLNLSDFFARYVEQKAPAHNIHRSA